MFSKVSIFAALVCGILFVTALPKQCAVSQDTLTFCVCTGRNANDLSLQTFTVSPEHPGQGSNVVFTYTGTIATQWIPTSNAVIQTVLYVDGIPRQRSSVPISAPAPFIFNLNPPTGPGSLAFAYGSGTWDQIGGQQIFFQQTFYDGAGNILLCVRSAIMSPS
jgi:hypothetical protein